ncbi:NADP-dependent 3-hydroxy acid dehydrogenase YdfG [Micromonospora phaseoli]|uniref:NADP-dependent 3-hydroxy acid dehydrogenase YdfG n=1 Tax=Micromonospora phaseoli TaxID=1144548 RepID=A0A1H6X6Y2_9ACTN|nr:SDR family NAD(P)-dependent oxidoreductase [Micromonospora phaseoli]PZW02126.1 NADP-dependent 3-hydroxy acid dehydrogenase YdfG [Micromonospora phaseoli]GIJ75872.1 short-chain dehydrogenase/reductase [Micromonospora phaseoli]SEJ24971.1 NADP-dependent 3-hydroxy acid dehydrogenase YdfG [Micromonospora phaseoli]
MADPRVWFITGATRGLGRAVTEAALATGDRVIGVARDVGPLTELAGRYPDTLVSLPLDVADRAAVEQVVDRAVATFGRLDVVVNNAGSLLLGMLEEATEEQIRQHFDVNFFGAVWVTQAVVPHLRAQGAGQLLQVTSMGSGGGVASVGFYAAGKAALDALSQSIAMELEPFGIKVTIVQPGGYDTGLYTVGTTATTPHPAYEPLRAKLAELWGDDAGPAPETAAPVIMALVDLPDPPLRLIVGGRSYDIVQQMEHDRVEEYRAWEHLSRQAPG